jgi:cytochrome c oxidase assembly protein subunit 15
VTGFFSAGTNAGISCNTFPKVGEHWFYNKNHFMKSDDVPIWKNFFENKLICQVNHRTLATIMTLWASVTFAKVLSLKHLTRGARGSMYFLIATLWMQLFIGANVIWNSVPVWMASSHQCGAMTVLTAMVFAMHNARKVDPRHIKNLLGKLKVEDRSAYEQMMKF